MATDGLTISDQEGAKIPAIFQTVLSLLVLGFGMALLKLDAMLYLSAPAGEKVGAVLWVALDLVFVAGFVGLSALDLWLVQEVNRSVTEGRRLNYWRWFWETPRVQDLYKQLYPDSKVNQAHRIMGVIYAPFLIAGVFRIRFVFSGSPSMWLTYIILVFIALVAIVSIFELLGNEKPKTKNPT